MAVGRAGAVDEGAAGPSPEIVVGETRERGPSVLMDRRYLVRIVIVVGAMLV